MTGQQNQVEAVFNFIDAIFYGETAHSLAHPFGGNLPCIRVIGITWRMEFQAFLSWVSLIRLLRDGIRAPEGRRYRILSARRDCAGGSQINRRRHDALLTGDPKPRTRSVPHCARQAQKSLYEL